MTVSVIAIDREGKTDELLIVANVGERQLYAEPATENGRQLFIGVDRGGVTQGAVFVPKGGRIEIEAC